MNNFKNDPTGFKNPSGLTIQTWGNTHILKLPKTGFLCSQRFTASAVLKSYDWAKEQRANDVCVLCGNHSQIEKDVFNILIKGTQPLILILPRGLKTRWESDIASAVENNRLLVISPFELSVKRVTRDTACIKNETIIELSDQLVVAYKTVGGQLDQLLAGKQYEML